MPKVSFIVAVFNSMPYLRQCLDSLTSQTIKDIEIICVNDCSPDDSQRVIEEYATKDGRIKLINHSINKRQGGAWNSGLEAATGEYLSFVDADDWVDCDYCERLNRGEKSDIICAKNYYRGNDVSDNINQKLLKKCNNDIRLYLLLFGMSFITNFIRREFLVSSGFRFLENNMYQDFMTNILYFKTNAISSYDVAGYHYRVDNVSIQRSMNQNGFWGRLDVEELELSKLKEISTTKEYRDAISFHFYSIFYRNTLSRAFYGFTELQWDKIEYIMKRTHTLLPNINDNPFYHWRYLEYPILLRIPVILFEHFSKKNVTVAHRIYLIIRNLKKS